MNIETIYHALSDMLCDAKDISPDVLSGATPLNQLELDSLDYVEMTVLVKRNFGVTLTGDVFATNPNMTLNGLCEFILTKSQEVPA